MGILSSLKKSKNSLLDQVKKLQSQGHEQDKRYLNYYDLKDNESMKILILPDTNGDLFVKYKKHGPNLHYIDAKGQRQGIRGLPSIGVYPNDSESPVMQKGYDLLQLHKDTGEAYYKEEAKKWFAKEYTVMSCIVLDSPFEVNHSPDGNDVKLVNVPYKVEQYIINQIMDEVISEEELFTTPFILKKSKNTGGWTSYETSYFARKALNVDEMNDIEEAMNITLFDYKVIDIVPPTPTIDELEEWLAKAEAAYEKATSGGGNTDDSSDEDEEIPVKKTAGTSLKDRIKKAPVKVEEEEEDDIPWNDEPPAKPKKVAKVEDKEPEEVDDEREKEEAPVKKSALAERLAKLRSK
jgi:hypothetical protein